MSFHTDRQEASVQRVKTRLENVLKIGGPRKLETINFQATRVNLIYDACVLLVTYIPKIGSDIHTHSNATAYIITSFDNIPRWNSEESILADFKEINKQTFNTEIETTLADELKKEYPYEYPYDQTGEGDIKSICMKSEVAVNGNAIGIRVKIADVEYNDAAAMANSQEAEYEAVSSMAIKLMFSDASRKNIYKGLYGNRYYAYQSDKDILTGYDYPDPIINEFNQGITVEQRGASAQKELEASRSNVQERKARIDHVQYLETLLIHHELPPARYVLVTTPVCFFLESVKAHEKQIATWQALSRAERPPNSGQSY
jgi:hypothetical protein